MALLRSMAANLKPRLSQIDNDSFVLEMAKAICSSLIMEKTCIVQLVTVVVPSSLLFHRIVNFKIARYIGQARTTYGYTGAFLLPEQQSSVVGCTKYS